MSIADYNAWRAQEQAGAWQTIVEWAGVAAVVVGSVALIACTGGAAIPVLAGVGGLLGVGGTALDDMIHGGNFDPKGLLLGGLSGMAVGTVSAWVPPIVVAEGSSIFTLLGTQALVSGATSASTNLASQQLLYRRVDWATVAIAGGAGTFAGMWPGAVPGADAAAADPAAALSNTLFGPKLTAAQSTLINGVLIGEHGGVPSTIVQAGTDGGGPGPEAPGDNLSKVRLLQRASLKPSWYYAAGAR
jgi:hypothetical protein